MRDQVNRLCQWPQLTRKLFALAAKKCFKLNNNLPQELELHFALDLVLVPQVVLASHLLFKGIDEFSRPNASDVI